MRRAGMIQAMTELKEELKRRIVAQLELEEVAPAAIEDDAPLFGEGLGLDSIDALELVAMLERDYGIEVKDRETGRAAFASVQTLAEFIERHRKG
jgi:acyl carrier protein